MTALPLADETAKPSPAGIPPLKAAHPTADDVAKAAGRIKGHVVRTPMYPAPKLGDAVGVDLWVKQESFQYTGAFKERGALNKLLTLSDTERACGVCAASAGNHAQGLAHHAGKLGVGATIFMPKGTPVVKVQQTEEFGAKVVIDGDCFEDAYGLATRHAKEHGSTFVHPFDDPQIIAGQGTVAMEMLEEAGDLQVLLVPIGGGGLISGMALAAKAHNPDLEVIGVQSKLYPSMYNTVYGRDEPVGGATLAEGIAVKEPGRLTRALVADLVDDIVLVDERELERAVSLFLRRQNVLAEGAAAAGFAAVLSDPERFRGKRVGTVLSASNIDTRLLTSILMRDLARAGRLARLRIELLDIPGELLTVVQAITDKRVNIVDVGHHRIYSDLPAKVTYIDITVETQDRPHLDGVIEELRNKGYRVTIAAY